jgi:outer membrane protein TolC
MSELLRTGCLIAMLSALPGVARAQGTAPGASAPQLAPATPAPPQAAAPVPTVPIAGAKLLNAREAVKLALRYNAEYRGAELDIRAAEQGVRAQEGNYPYVYQADAGFTRSERAVLDDNDNVTGSSLSRTYTIGNELRRTFPTGTTAKLRVEGSRFDNDFETTNVLGERSSAGYRATGRAEVTQPLLRGFGTKIGEAELRQARISKDVTEKSYRRLTSQLVRDTLGSYWELWFASEALQIELAALELAKRQETEADARVKGGALSMAELLSFQTRVAQLEESVVAAEVDLRRRSLELGALLGSSDESAPQLVAVNEPPAVASTATRADVEAALRSGSVELAALEAQVRLARSRAEVAGEGQRPSLDLAAFVETNGESERVGKAFERAGRMSWLTVGATATFQVNLDNTRYDAERTGALLAVRSAEQDVKIARDRILADATMAVTNESAAHRRFGLAERTLQVAERAWEAEKARFELGQSIPITVQQAEDELRRARLRLARARVDLAQAQLAVLHLAGKLVQRYASG